MQFGAAAVAQAGTLFVPPAHYPSVNIRTPDRSRRLTELPLE
jgi:hypothetical protein